MIKTYTASPKRFNQLDLHAAGSGSEINRYGLGLYFSDQDVAEAYLDTYKDYSNADPTFSLEGERFNIDSIEHKVAEFLTRAPDKNVALEAFSNDSLAKAIISTLITDHNEVKFTTKRGVLYEVAIPGIDADSLKHWDDPVSYDELDRLFNEFHNMNTTIDNDIFFQADALGIESNADDFEEFVDDVLDVAIDQAHETSDINFDEDAMRSIFLEQVRGQYGATEQDVDHINYYDDFDEVIDSKYLDLIECVSKGHLTLENGMSNGDLYQAISAGFSSIKNLGHGSVEANRFATDFIAKHYASAFKADALHGHDNAIEIVLYDEHLASQAKLTEIEHPLSAQDPSVFRMIRSDSPEDLKIKIEDIKREIGLADLNKASNDEKLSL